jgi:hypothetical protein
MIGTQHLNTRWLVISAGASQEVLFGQIPAIKYGFCYQARVLPNDIGVDHIMGRVFGFVALIIVAAAGSYIYMRQAQSVTPAGSSRPAATVDLTGVRNDLLAIAQAERSHGALQGAYVSVEELRSQGELAMSQNGRAGYTYSAEVSSSAFRILATYSGADPGMPKTITIDQSMQISQE